MLLKNKIDFLRIKLKFESNEIKKSKYVTMKKSKTRKITRKESTV